MLFACYNKVLLSCLLRCCKQPSFTYKVGMGLAPGLGASLLLAILQATR